MNRLYRTKINPCKVQGALPNNTIIEIYKLLVNKLIMIGIDFNVLGSKHQWTVHKYVGFI